MMSPVVAAFIAALTCAQPVLDFRAFYHQFYFQGDHWAVSPETVSSVVNRFMDAQADFIEYRVARMEMCR